MSNVVAIIQARMSSSRLPGKVLKKLGNKTVIQWVIDRVRTAQKLNTVVVATSSEPSDNAIETYCIDNGIPCYRGPLDDVLGRFCGAATAYAAEHVVRITADCPFIDGQVIDLIIQKHLETGVDYTSNVATRTYPDGVDCEIVKTSILRNLSNKYTDPSIREHVTAGIHCNPENFTIANVEQSEDMSTYRWTLDTAEDYTWLSYVAEHIGSDSFNTFELSQWIIANDQLRLESPSEVQSPEDRLSGKGQELYEKAKKIIPGGTQLLSKRPEMFLPGRWPAYYSSVRGAWVKDLDGRGYLDMSTSGIGTCILGGADPVVNASVIEAVHKGSMSTLNPPEEVALAEKLCTLHPWANRVRFARTGGESMAIATRIARAATGKEIVLICGYHGWSDWYLATNLSKDGDLSKLLLPGLKPSGVPAGLSNTAVPFHFNNTEEFVQLMEAYAGRIAAVIMEPQRFEPLEDIFLQTVKARVEKENAVLVFDEITAGWRKNIGGIHMIRGVEPDIAVFGKALSNGYAMGAVIGKDSVMEAAQDTFISSTYWTERIGPTAALATLSRFEELNAPAILDVAGNKAQDIWQAGAANAGLPVNVGERDMAPLSHFAFNFDNTKKNRAARTLWCKEMLKRGVLDNGSFYATCAHQEAELDYYATHVDEVFDIILQSANNDTLEEDAGELSHGGFSRLN